MKYLGISIDDYDALVSADPKMIQSNVINFIVWCRNTKKLSPSSTKAHIAAVHKFYEMNDFDLRWKKINNYQGEFYKVVEDRAYTHEEIKKMLDISSSIRDNAILLLMCSSGIHVGAIGLLRFKDLTFIPDYNLYKITVYARYIKDQYFTYCTPEATNAINQSLDYRRRLGELLFP
jgi:integrase